MVYKIENKITYYLNIKDIKLKYNIKTKKIFFILKKNEKRIDFFHLGLYFDKNKNYMYNSSYNNLYFYQNIIKNKIKELYLGFFIQLKLKGVGYSMFIYSQYLYIDLGFSHYIALKIPETISVKRFKTSLAIFGYSKRLVKDFVKKLLNLKKIDKYKGKGFMDKDLIIILKEGKKR